MSTPLVTTSDVGTQITAFATLGSGLQTQLIAEATELVNRECDRVFGAANYDEIHHPGRTRVVRLRQWPITAITRACADLETLLFVQYAGSAPRASLSWTTTGPADSPTYTGVSLQAAGGSATPLLFSTYTTVGALASAINAVSGWSATVTSGQTAGSYADWLTADLNPQVGTVDAMNQPAELAAFIRDIPATPRDWNSNRVDLYEDFPDNHRYPDRRVGYWGWIGAMGVGPGVSPRYGGVRLTYSAGWQTADVPWDLKQVAILTIRYLMDRNAVSGVFSGAKVSDGEFRLATQDGGLPPDIRGKLDRYRRMELA